MINIGMIESRLFSSGLIFGAALASSALGAAVLENDTAHPAANDRIHIVDATAAQNDNFKKAMELLQREGTKPSRADVDRAGHMLMESGPDAFEKAMNLLSRPNVKSSDVAAAKQQMMKGGPDSSEKAMKLLRGSFGY